MNNRPQKQSMAELKLRRVTEHIQRLRDDLARPRVRVSEAAQSLIRYTRTTKDPLVCFFSLLVHCRCGLLVDPNATGPLLPRPLQEVALIMYYYYAAYDQVISSPNLPANPMLTGISTLP